MTHDAHICLTAAGSTLTAGYTADGIRAWKQGSGARTYFLYDGELLLGEYDSAGTVTAVNTWGANGLVSRRSGGSSVHYTWDAQGSLAQRLDGAGTVLTSHLYDAFGAESASGSTTDPYRYGGQWGYYTDGETGLCLLTHRYYDPGTGRFLNRDPIGYAGGVNVYGYVRNSPAASRDPSGLVRWIEDRRLPGEPWLRPYHHSWILFGPGVASDCTDKSFGFWQLGSGPSLESPDFSDPRKPPKGSGGPPLPSKDVAVDNSPAFERALCECIKAARRGPPPSMVPPFYTCGSWAKDMWGCANMTVDPSAGAFGEGTLILY